MLIGLVILVALLALFLVPPMVDVVRHRRVGWEWDDLQNAGLGGGEPPVPDLSQPPSESTPEDLDELLSIEPERPPSGARPLRHARQDWGAR